MVGFPNERHTSVSLQGPWVASAVTSQEVLEKLPCLFLVKDTIKCFLLCADWDCS